MEKNNNYEIELKFKVDDHKGIIKFLEEMNAEFVGKAFERTVRFDTNDQVLEKSGRFLRTRTGFKNVITFKRKIDSDDFKEREEIEFEISDPEKMNYILKNLGFSKILIMEKNREKWNYKNTEVVLDELPMGNYIEIEGEKESIFEVVKDFQLNIDDKITGTYWDIWREFANKNKIDNENIIFK